MRILKKLSAVLASYPEFSSKIEWKKKDENVFCANPQYGSISHGVICKESGEPIYDLPVVEFIESAIVIPYNLDERGRISKIVIIQSERPVSGLKLWEFPGGFLDENESPEKAVLRELVEETGLIGRNLLFLGKVVPEKVTYKKAGVHIFALEITSSTKEIKTDIRESKVIASKYLSVSEYEDLLTKEKNHCGITLASWALFRAYFRSKL
jgi:8-oxo-dGTP pyrophosphatase MutT (NUDIX family)